jgi:DNA polymerase elongation subunit (family B)
MTDFKIFNPDVNDFGPSTSVKFLATDWAICDLFDDSLYELEEEEKEEPREFDSSDDDDGYQAKKIVKKDLQKPNNNYKGFRFTIKVYGRTEVGNTVCVHLTHFNPFFYIRVPDGWTTNTINRFLEKVLSAIDPKYKNSFSHWEYIYAKELFWFSDNTKVRFAKLNFFTYGAFSAVRYALANEDRESGAQRFNFGAFNDEVPPNHFKHNCYESNLPPLLRFFHIQKIEPCNWLEIKGGDHFSDEKRSRSQIDICAHYTAIKPSQSEVIAPVVIASFDIECVRYEDDGQFPLATVRTDEVIQIGTTYHRVGEEECFAQYIAVLKDSAPIDDDIVENAKQKNIILESFQTEKDLIIGWARFIQKSDPDILTGYNIHGFDERYIYDRVCCNFVKNEHERDSMSYLDELCKILSRSKKRKARFISQTLESAALGKNKLEYFDIEGIVQIDMYKNIMRDHKLESYKLNSVSEIFLGMNKVDLPPQELFRYFRDGSPEKIRDIAVYCLMDCELCNKLIMKLSIIPSNLGMGNVCLVPFSFLFMRGQGIKLFSLVANECMIENFLIRDISKDIKNTASYEGAIVFDPKPDIYYDPVPVMDYASLYPSSMIERNISHDTLTKVKTYNIVNGETNVGGSAGNVSINKFIKRNVDPDDLIEIKSPTLQNNEIDTGFIKNNIQYELVNDEGDEKYNNLDNYLYNNIEYDLFEKTNIAIEKGLQYRLIYDKNGKVNKDKVIIGKQICRFAEDKECVDETQPNMKGDMTKKGLLPRIEMKLLIARRTTRAKIKHKNVPMKTGEIIIGTIIKPEENDTQNIEKNTTHLWLKNLEGQKIWIPRDEINEEDISDVYNDFQKAILDGLQQAYKLVCNSLYGQLGADVSAISMKCLAASITCVGREMLEIARDLTLERYCLRDGDGNVIPGTQVILVYGDTDSIFVNFVPYIKATRDDSDQLTKQNLLELSIELGQEAGEYITKQLKYPQELEYEKTFYPFTIFSKKRYFGNLYETNPNKHKPKSMGIILKRRDNVPFARDVYAGVINIILSNEDKSIASREARKFFIIEINKLLRGEINIDLLMMSKSLGNDYADPTTCAHNVLAQRIGIRTPGKKPQSNDRVKYGFINSSFYKCKVCEGDITESNCKCPKCIEIYCALHINDHHKVCTKNCRYCRNYNDEDFFECKTCFANYCIKCKSENCKTCTKNRRIIEINYNKLKNKKDVYGNKHSSISLQMLINPDLLCPKSCFRKHQTRNNKKLDIITYNRCQKAVSKKLLQGDLIEDPDFITDNTVPIDYRYVFDRQIKNPIMQIFELAIDNPKSIIESVLRQESNRRRGNREITSFFISKPSKVIDNFEGITNFEFDEVEIPDDFNTTKEG